MRHIKKHIHWDIVGTFVVLLLLFAFPAEAAVTNFTGAAAKGQTGLNVKDIVSNLAIINTFMHVIILITLNFVQYLLQADFFTNPAMMDALNRIWQLSRDVMNVIFALMLIGVALYTIITADKKYVTDKLQTFVMAVILVNMSWFFPRVIIDVANVLTATIYTVPDLMTGGFDCKTWNLDGKPIEPCKAIIGIKILPVNEAAQEAFCTVELPNVPRSDCHCYDIACYKTGSLAALRASGNAGAGHVMINGLVVNFVKILDMPKVAASVAAITAGTPREGYLQSLQILMVIFMAFVFQLAIVLPLIGLAIGLLIRILIIWITTAFMPFAFLGYVINGKLGTNVFEFEHDIWKEFIAAAFMPAVVAVPISIGFIMLTAVTQVTVPLGATPLTFDVPMFVSVKSWWVMMWQVAAIMIVWTGTFAALSKSKIIGGFTDKLKGYGEGIFNTAKMLPLIVPLPLPGGTNLGGIINKPKQFGQLVRSSAETGRPIGEAIQGGPGGAGNRGSSTDGLANLMNTEKQNTRSIVEEIRKLGAAGTAGERASIINGLKTRLEISGVTNLAALERLKTVITTPGMLQADTSLEFTDEIKAALQKGIDDVKSEPQ